MEIVITVVSVGLLAGIAAWLFLQGGRRGVAKAAASEASEWQRVQASVDAFADVGDAPVPKTSDPALFALQATLMRIDRNLETIKILILAWFAINLFAAAVAGFILLT